jgi:hypothetical protein
MFDNFASVFGIFGAIFQTGEMKTIEITQIQ